MEVSCPVSTERANEHTIRMIAFLVAMIAIICISFGNYWVMFFLTIDFGLRAFTTGKWSLLKLIAQQIIKIGGFANKPTDLAPKKFAATMGFVFCLMIAVLTLLTSNPILLALITSLLLIFALLESLFAICVGCHIYTFYQKLFVKQK